MTATSISLTFALTLSTSLSLNTSIFYRGDANVDESLDISDSVHILVALFLANEPPACQDAADVNDDGTVDLSDALHGLRFLFANGPPSPPPAPGSGCPGIDPTVDELDCLEGLVPPADNPPAVSIVAVEAWSPGIRQRNRCRLEEVASGRSRIDEGVAFAILVKATSNLFSTAGFTLQDPGGSSAGHPMALDVRCNRDLGDPSLGGVAAGENLAAVFLRDTDLWRNEIYLIEHVALRIAGDGPLGPAAGEYRFTATVVDDACVRSAESSFTLNVDPSSVPEIFTWIESDQDGTGTASLLQHDAGTGNVRLPTPAMAGTSLIIDGLPGGHGGSAPDPTTLHVTATPPLPGGSDLTSQLAPVAGFPARFAMTLADDWFPDRGNTDLEITLKTTTGVERSVRFRLEVAVGHETDIMPIWATGCSGCHEKPSPRRGLVLVDPSAETVFRNIVNVFAAEPRIDSIAPLLVWPYFPDRSYLLHKIRGTHTDPAVAGSGVRMPADEGYLDTATERLIESWILQGAVR